MKEVSIKIGNITLDVKGWYDEGESGLWTYPNGDPGYPELPPSFEIESICYEEKDITQLIDSLNDVFLSIYKKTDKIIYEDLYSEIEYLVLKELEK